MTAANLPGHRVLVVEDEMLIGQMLEIVLQEAGYVVLGPFPRVAPALDAIAGETAIDVAVLDVLVNGEPVFPVAQALASRQIPFLFTTGYGPAGVPPIYRDRPILTKPFRPASVIATLAGILSPVVSM